MYEASVEDLYVVMCSLGLLVFFLGFCFSGNFVVLEQIKIKAPNGGEDLRYVSKEVLFS